MAALLVVAVILIALAIVAFTRSQRRAAEMAEHRATVTRLVRGLVEEPQEDGPAFRVHEASETLAGWTGASQALGDFVSELVPSIPSLDAPLELRLSQLSAYLEAMDEARARCDRLERALEQPLGDVGPDRWVIAIDTAVVLTGRQLDNSLGQAFQVASRPPDPHRDDVDALRADMRRLGLDRDGQLIPEVVRYAEIDGGFDTGRQALTAEFLDSLTDAADEQGHRVTAVGGPPGMDVADDELRTVVEELRNAAAAYVARVEALVAEARNLRGAGVIDVPAVRPDEPRLQGPARAIDACNERLEADDLIGALLTLTAGLPPAVRSWAPSDAYQAVCLRTSDRLDRLASDLRASIKAWLVAAIDAHGAAHDALHDTLRCAYVTLQEGRERAWDGLEGAAIGAKRAVVTRTVGASAEEDWGRRVRAGMAAVVVQDRAAENVGRLVHGFIPRSDECAEDVAHPDPTHRVDRLFRSMDANAAVYAGFDAVIQEALDPGGAGMWRSMQVLAGVPDDLHGAGGAIVGYVSGENFPVDLRNATDEFAENVLRDLTPHLGTINGDENNLQAVKDLLMPLVSNLQVSVLRSGPVGGAATYLGRAAADATWSLVKDASRTIEIQEAMDHVADAGRGVAEFFGFDGVLGHLPWITMAMSTVREVRLNIDNKTTIENSVRNIVIDVAGVGVGIAAGAALAGLLGGPAIIVTVPTAVIARTFGQRYKARPYRLALARYAEADQGYEEGRAALTREFADAVTKTVDRERAHFLTTVSSPARPMVRGNEELSRLVDELRTAVETYLDHIGALVAEVGRLSVMDRRTAVDLAALAERVDRVRTTLGAGDEQTDEDDVVQALLVLTAEPLPVVTSWAPSDVHQAACQRMADLLHLLGEGHRSAVTAWAAQSVESYRNAQDLMAQRLEPVNAAVRQGFEALNLRVALAADAVTHEAKALGPA